MASDTSSKPHSAPAFERLAETLARAPARSIVLALRVLDLERVAWREGRDRAVDVERRATLAFARACRRTLRRGDALAHEAASDLMVAALVAPGVAIDVARAARAVLGELTAAMGDAGFTVEGGWTLYERASDPDRALRAAAAAALERGRVERERFGFFATLGHEMRTPLMSIDGYIAVLLECDLDPATRRRFLEVAQGESVRLRRLVENMYALSLADLDDAVVGAASCAAQHAVERACDAMFPLAARRDVTLRVKNRVRAAIPFTAERAVQLFVSILENAIKHGNEHGRVEVSLDERDGSVFVSFDDDGPGVEECDRTRVFALFARGSHAAAPGNGLGLAIVRATIERAGGDVSVSRSPLGGARFVLRLPTPDAALDASAHANVHDDITMRSR